MNPALAAGRFDCHYTEILWIRRGVLTSAKFSQCGFHFRAGMLIASSLRGCYSGAQRGLCLRGACGLSQELPVLEISGDIFGMRGKERFKILVSSGGVPGIGALHRQAVAGKRVCGFCGDEIFENLAACLLLWLGQSHAHSIFARQPNAKCGTAKSGCPTKVTQSYGAHIPK
jgi:hypothetical protein